MIIEFIGREMNFVALLKSGREIATRFESKRIAMKRDTKRQATAMKASIFPECLPQELQRR
ncbi:hypothetical protein K0M31_012691 [Melipona bicolor]|uniref:Uncharacterized protein n=1 Tax=Melipona bicolor TaxID=60889 RepID=A0AA40FIZ9_9HYME|nr:hypothetical protein K0M31_012691 [Melipona bicolor]